MIDTVKLSARYQYDEAIELVERYIVRAGEEIKNAKEAAEICEVLCEASESEDSIKIHGYGKSFTLILLTN